MHTELRDSLSVFDFLSTQNRKMNASKQDPCPQNVGVPSSRLILTWWIFGVWNFHFLIFSYDLWNSMKTWRAGKIFALGSHVAIFDFKISFSEKKLTISESTVYQAFMIFSLFLIYFQWTFVRVNLVMKIYENCWNVNFSHWF